MLLWIVLVLVVGCCAAALVLRSQRTSGPLDGPSREPAGTSAGSARLVEPAASAERRTAEGRIASVEPAEASPPKAVAPPAHVFEFRVSYCDGAPLEGVRVALDGGPYHSSDALGHIRIGAEVARAEAQVDWRSIPAGAKLSEERGMQRYMQGIVLDAGAGAHAIQVVSAAAPTLCVWVDGVRAPGTQVRLVGLDVARQAKTLVSDAGALIPLAGLPPGTYAAGRAGSAPVRFRLACSETGVRDLYFTDSGADAALRVVDPEGRPIAGARLHLRPVDAWDRPELGGAWDERGVTDARGVVAFAKLTPGRYQVWARHARPSTPWKQDHLSCLFPGLILDLRGGAAPELVMTRMPARLISYGRSDAQAMTVEDVWLRLEYTDPTGVTHQRVLGLLEEARASAWIPAGDVRFDAVAFDEDGTARSLARWSPATTEGTLAMGFAEADGFFDPEAERRSESGGR